VNLPEPGPGQPDLGGAALPLGERLMASTMAQLLGSRKAGLSALSLAGALAIALHLATSPVPQSLQITGYSGHLAEWSITAALAKTASGRELSGPLTMQHTGLCSVDGPERKTGEMRLRLARFSSRIDARLAVDDVECSYSGSLSEVYTGQMVCPDRQPMPLILWMR
jgi:hypothetical protein